MRRRWKIGRGVYPWHAGWAWPAKLLFLSTLCSQFSLAPSLEPPGHVIRYDGDVNIGVLVDLHSDFPEDSATGCGHINMEAVQQVLAAKWAIDVINNQSLPHELNIGLQIHDTCSNKDLGQEQLFELISIVQNSRSSSPKPRLIGLIGMGDPKSLLTASAALNAFHVPVVAVSPGFYSSVGGQHHQNILTTAPDLAGQARSLVNIGYEIGANKIALISSSQSTVASFLSESTTLGIRVPEILELIPKQVNIGLAVEGFLRGLRRQLPVVAMILDAADIVAVAEHLKNIELPNNPTWLIGSLGLELRRLKSWKAVYKGGAFVEPHMPELREFKNFFLDSLTAPDDKLSQVTEEYMAENTGCVPAFSNGKGVSCNNIPLREMELRFQQDPQVSFVVKAVSALTAAFRLVQLDSCGQSVEAACLRTVAPDLHHDILENLHKLSFTSMASGLTEVDGTRHHFTKGGRLVANKQIVYTIVEDKGLEPIGWYSEDEGLNIKEDVLPTSVPDTTTTSEPITAPRSSPLINNNSDRSAYSRSIDSEEETANQDIIKPMTTSQDMTPIASYESFIGRTWSLVVISMALFGICISLWMLVYVFIKMCDGTLTGNQSMGVLLLGGVMLIFASVVPWLLPPNEMICAIRHFFHPLAFCLCFGLLLIKVMQLRSLVSVGLGGTIPQVNQLLSLFFIVMVQVVITTEWYVINMPLQIRVTDGYPECDVAKETFLLLHVYPSLLLILTFLYGMSVFKIKRNFNEGRWVTCATVCIIPVMSAWSLIYYFAPNYFHDPSNAVSIVTIGGILVTTIFFPKMHTISQQSKYRKLKIHSPGSDSTVYTSYSDYPNYSMYYPSYPPPYPSNHFHKNMQRYSRSHSGHRMNMQRMSANPHLNRFNGLNYLSNPFLGPNATSYTDWSREHTPGNYHSGGANPYAWKKIVSINPHGMTSRKSKTPEGTLASSKRSSKRNSPEVIQGVSPTKKSSLKHSHHGLVLNPNGLPNNQSHYDENSRVYHITP